MSKMIEFNEFIRLMLLSKKIELAIKRFVFLNISLKDISIAGTAPVSTAMVLLQQQDNEALAEHAKAICKLFDDQFSSASNFDENGDDNYFHWLVDYASTQTLDYLVQHTNPSIDAGSLRSLNY